jgi:hypothetical protein
MAARRARIVGLTDQDVQQLREQLAGGKRPRVQLSGSQFAAAPSATVIRIGDPTVDGSDYLTVRVKVNGVLDELAFAPAELQLGNRRADAARKRRKPTGSPTVAFTVASSGDSWTISANRGAKGIVKNVPVQPGVVTALAELLAQPALLDAVAEINQTALSQAQARADELRAELHRLEAVLATHRSPGA